MSDHDANAPVEHYQEPDDDRLLRKIEKSRSYGKDQDQPWFGLPARDIHEAGLEELNRNHPMRGADDNFGFPKPADDYFEEPTFELGTHPVVLDGTQVNFGGARSYIRSIGTAKVRQGEGESTVIEIKIDVSANKLVDGKLEFTGHSFVFTPGNDG